MDMAQLMPLPLTVSCFSKIQIGFTSDLVVKFELGGLVICKKIPQDHNIIAEKL